MKQYNILNLYDLTQTIAADLFTGKEYPWEVLSEISEFILKLGETLDANKFDKVADNIWIAKSDNKIRLENMYESYNIRPELLKSRQFYNNAFDTSVNYEDLMALKKELMR